MWDAYAKVSYEKIQAAKAHAETTDELTQGLKDDLKRAADFRSQAADSRAHALDCSYSCSEVTLTQLPPITKS